VWLEALNSLRGAIIGTFVGLSRTMVAIVLIIASVRCTFVLFECHCLWREISIELQCAQINVRGGHFMAAIVKTILAPRSTVEIDDELEY
jgi:hypothetical protein